MDGDGPRQADGELGERAQFFFLNLLLLFVVGVADVAPCLAANVAGTTVVGGNVECLAVEVEAAHHADGAVHPPAFVVVLDEDDLCARL